MTTFAILATGESMSQAVADSVKHLRRIAVSDAFRLCMDAEALCCNDPSWWKANMGAITFKGRKFSTNAPAMDVEKVPTTESIMTGTNSGLLGVHVAIRTFKATEILLYGFDMRGTHYFGPHKAPGLANTKPERFEDFKGQFATYPVPAGVRILNATPGSALKCYPFLT